MDKTLRQIDQELVEAMREKNLKNAEILDELSAEAQRLGMYDAPSRGVVDGATFARAWAAYEAAECEPFTNHTKTRLRAALQAAALPAVPEVDPMAAFFAKRKEDEAQVFIARAKHALREILVALEDEDYEESRSLILDALGESATPAHDQPEGADND